MVSPLIVGVIAFAVFCLVVVACIMISKKRDIVDSVVSYVIDYVEYYAHFCYEEPGIVATAVSVYATLLILSCTLFGSYGILVFAGMCVVVSFLMSETLDRYKKYMANDNVDLDENPDEMYHFISIMIELPAPMCLVLSIFDVRLLAILIPGFISLVLFFTFVFKQDEPTNDPEPDSDSGKGTTTDQEALFKEVEERLKKHKKENKDNPPEHPEDGS